MSTNTIIQSSSGGKIIVCSDTEHNRVSITVVENNIAATIHLGHPWRRREVQDPNKTAYRDNPEIKQLIKAIQAAHKESRPS
ncbi:MAG: hypothetical protein UW81_C0001G0018 [Candidatus Giovannonibacteria bacterium GW2011_GWC2_44_9]|uniref:Uncharacterized protein n=3 Tax=Candidatus Giovannoniibacteriota TaxID=1752738 RepID=A0A0G1IXU8_9BACT|nr:MAG: hypothetical protein UW49_C0002G0086 [Candidatus Giovannonibacteria bacterium GW2011_GWB1_44_23]KKT64206.1 MAG: hypothetical protein UW57_C0002G0086 [Candidatus Giovannonibacteria bacterium GW2011_GWA1_44_29]KKT84443.1 MAG: hypothetical protein UW81_C0001G0018 [Candidatus Giovannonibacteria bacterium GW2011_GWC2_44_9]KKT91807.1 MAG: hypothetical protein UW93_C0003G0087 [Parcubacteria group bacterium GW2011_GWC1_45_13]